MDFERRSLKAARTPRPGQLILGDLGRETVRRISPAALAELEARAGQLLDHDDTPQAVFTADSMHLLAIVDGDRGYELSPAGPITEGPAAELMRLLHDLAWPKGPSRIRSRT